MTLDEALISTEHRLRADEAMVSFLEASPDWGCFWFAGLMSDLMSTLPPNDPWRALSGAVDLTALSIKEASDDPESRFVWRNPLGAEPPPGTGAVFADGRAFGDETDSDDLVVAGFDDRGTDVALVALVEPLEPVSAAIVAVASAGAEQSALLLGKVHHHLWLSSTIGPTGPAGRMFFQVLAPALRRVVHRRRLYAGRDDMFTSHAAYAWMARADRLVARSVSVKSQLGLADEAALPAEAYDELRVDPEERL